MGDETENTEATVATSRPKDAKFYAHSREYWSKIPATVDGMLGGLEFVSENDIKQSQELLDWLFTNGHISERNLALDCGAGIGRVTKNLLFNNFNLVEMVDVNNDFINEAKNYIGNEDIHRVQKFHVSGLESFMPEENKYDCIWMQWVLGYLQDKDLIEFLKRCKKALKPNGICVLKENVSSKLKVDLDEDDNCYTRPRQNFIDIIHKAKMHVISDDKQRKFPKDLYEVRLISFK